jgi:hypothetical protein
MRETVALGARRAIWLVLLGAAAGLSACENAPVHSMPCPMVQVVPDAGYVTRFAGDSEDLTDTDYEARLSIADQMCHYVVNNDTKKTSIQTDLSVQVTASRGPKNKGDKADIKYYVALTGSGGKQIMRQAFGLEVPLPQTQPTAAVIDNPQITIPLPKDQNGDYFRIYLYFDVTPKELAYNRRNPQQ